MDQRYEGQSELAQEEGWEIHLPRRRHHVSQRCGRVHWPYGGAHPWDEGWNRPNCTRHRLWGGLSFQSMRFSHSRHVPQFRLSFLGNHWMEVFFISHTWECQLLVLHRLQVGEATCLRGVSWQCHLHQGTTMKLKYNLRWSEECLQCWELSPPSACLTLPTPSTWLTAPDASFHGPNLVSLCSMSLGFFCSVRSSFVCKQSNQFWWCNLYQIFRRSFPSRGRPCPKARRFLGVVWTTYQLRDSLEGMGD